MTTSRTVKISVSLPADVVAAVDRRAKTQPGSSRSSVVADLLRRGVRSDEEASLRESIRAYYASMSDEERLEEAAIGRALSLSARRLDIDGGAGARTVSIP